MRPVETSDSGFKCTVVADSISAWSKRRLITVALRYPRFIHSELMTHRVFSRNASSSRAIPVKTMLRSLDVAALRQYMQGLFLRPDHSLRPKLKAFAKDHGVLI